MELPKHIDAYLANNEDSSSALNSIILSVFSKSIDLPSLVGQLGASLTSPQDEVRARGTLLLAEVLSRLPGITLTSQVLTSLVTFFVQRLHDYVCIKEVILGLSALVQNHTLPSGTATQILKGIFKEQTVQTLLQSTRKKIFEMIQIFTEKYREEVLEMKDAFVSGFMQSMDGEKDPRNLLICFSLADFTLSNFAQFFTPATLEEMFDITACYFPITFTAPKNDPHGITGEDLKEALTRCLSAHDGLVNHTFPLMIEKMDSGLYSSKVDALATIAGCMRRQGGKPLEPFAGAIWSNLKREIVSGVDADLVAAALDTLQAFVSVACPDQIGGFFVSPSVAVNVESPLWTEFMDPMLEDCERELKVPDAKIARVYGKILSSSCGASGNAMERVLERMWSCIEERFLIGTMQASQRQALLEMVGDILIKSARLKLNPSRPHPLAAYVEKMSTVFFSSLIGGYARMRCVAIIGLGALAHLSHPFPPSSSPSSTTSTTTAIESSSAVFPSSFLLSPLQIQPILTTTTRLLFEDEDADVRRECLNSLVRLSAHHTQAFLDTVLPPLFAFPGLHVDTTSSSASSSSSPASTLPLSMDERDDVSQDKKSTDDNTNNDNENVSVTLHIPSVDTSSSSSSASSSSSSSSIPASASPMALTPLSSEKHLPHQHREKQTVGNTLEAVAALGAHPILFKACVPPLLAVLAAQFQDGTMSSPELTYSVLTCLNKMVNANVEGEGLKEAVVSLPVSLLTAFTKASLAENGIAPVSEVEEILGTLIRAAPLPEHTAMLERVVSLFVDGNVAQFGIVSAIPFQPFAPGSPEAQTRMIPLMSQMLGNHRVEAQVPQLDRIIGTLITFILNASETEVSAPTLSALQCLGALVNKFQAGLPLDAFVTVILAGQLKNKVMEAANPGKDRLAALRAFIWVSKGLVMRGHSESNSLGDFLCRLLLDSDLSVATLAAEGFDVILSDCATLLNKRSLAIVAPLYKQKFFVENFDRLLGIYASSSRTAAGGVVLMAMSYLLRHLPYDVLEPHLPKALPLMIQSLQADNAFLRRSTLKTMSILMQADISSVSSHASTIIPVMLRLTRDQSDMHTRILAALCLEHLSKLPFHLLFPHKTQVLKELHDVLDDKKRLVRKQAVRTRNIWFSLSEGGAS